MSSKDESVQKMIIILLSAPFLWTFRAFVMVDLWVWFMVPLGVVEVGMAHMYGITLVGTLVSGISNSPKDDSSALESILMSIFISLMFWGVGAISYSFM